MNRVRAVALVAAVMMLLGNALGVARAQLPASWLASGPTTLSCSARLPAAVLGCLVEKPFLVLGPVELAVGVDVQAVFSREDQSYIAPFAMLAVYQSDWSAWLEVWMPSVLDVPLVGKSDFLRVGFTVTFR